jgi:hypothetical protein
VPARPAAATPDRLTHGRSMGTLKTGAVPVDACYVTMSRRFFLPVFALCALLALIPSRAVAHDGPKTGAPRRPRGPTPPPRSPRPAPRSTGSWARTAVPRSTRSPTASRSRRSSSRRPARRRPAGQGGPVSVTVTGLTPGTTYHVRLITRVRRAGRDDRERHHLHDPRAPVTAPAPAPAPGRAVPGPRRRSASPSSSPR